MLHVLVQLIVHQAIAALSPLFAFFLILTRLFQRFLNLLKLSSVLMVSISDMGLTLPATWTISSFSKQRTTCAMASVSRILARNLLPNPSPFAAPATNPAISQI